MGLRRTIDTCTVEFAKLPKVCRHIKLVKLSVLLEEIQGRLVAMVTCQCALRYFASSQWEKCPEGVLNEELVRRKCNSGLCPS
jgi:hypothetical protein